MDSKKCMQQIKQGDIQPLYLLYGKEWYLLDQTLEEIKQRLIPDYAQVFDYVQLSEKNLSIQDLCHQLDAIPVMAEKRLIVVRDDPRILPQKKSNSKTQGTNSDAEDGEAESSASRLRTSTEKDKEALALENAKKEIEELRKHLNGQVCLVFILYEEASRQELSKTAVWTKFLSEAGEMVEFARVNAADAAEKIQEMAKKLHVQLLRGDALDLFERLGGNLQMVWTEMQKLASYVGEGHRITHAVIQELSPPNTELKVFGVLDSFSGRKVGEGMKQFEQLLAEGEAALRIISVLGTYLRTRMYLDALPASGLDTNAAAKALGLRTDAMVKNAMRRRTRVSQAEWQALCRENARLEAGIKQGKMRDKEGLRLFMVKLAAMLAK